MVSVAVAVDGMVSLMLKRVGVWSVVVLGLAVALWGAVSLAFPATSCRGQEMGPGDLCEVSAVNAERSGKVQRYEDRIAVIRQQAPFVIIAGLGLATFGFVVARSATAQAPSDHKPTHHRSRG